MTTEVTLTDALTVHRRVTGSRYARRVIPTGTVITTTVSDLRSMWPVAFDGDRGAGWIALGYRVWHATAPMEMVTR